LDLSPVERMNLIADSWALFRAGTGSLDAVLNLLGHVGEEPDYVVLGEAVSRLDLIERRAVTDETRPAFQKFVRDLLRRQLDTLGLDPRTNEGDTQRLRRAAVVRGLALIGRVPEVVKE